MSVRTCDVSHSVQQLKDIGNAHYVAKEYHEAIFVYTRAIRKKQKGTAETKSMCYLNRALAKQILKSEFAIEEVHNDILCAIRLNNKYAKAFLHLSRLYLKLGHSVDSFVEYMSAGALDAKTSLPDLEYTSLVYKKACEEFNESWKVRSKSASRRPKTLNVVLVQVWVYGNQNDILKRDLRTMVQQGKTPNSPYERALMQIARNDYNEVSITAENEDPCSPKYVEACLLAALFYGFEEEFIRARLLLDCCNRELFDSHEVEDQRKCCLLSSMYTVRIFSSRNKEDVVWALSEAIAFNSENVNFYVVASIVFAQHNSDMLMDFIGHACDKFEDNITLRLLRNSFDAMILHMKSGHKTRRKEKELNRTMKETLEDNLSRVDLFTLVHISNWFLVSSHFDYALQFSKVLVDAVPSEGLFWAQRGKIYNKMEKYMEELRCYEDGIRCSSAPITLSMNYINAVYATTIHNDYAKLFDFTFVWTQLEAIFSHVRPTPALQLLVPQGVFLYTAKELVERFHSVPANLLTFGKTIA